MYRCIGPVLLSVLGIAAAQAQTTTTCLIYSFSYSGLVGTGPTATAAVQALFSQLSLCGSSTLVLNSITSDSATAGGTFTFVDTYTASPGCGNAVTGGGTGNITSSSGWQCTNSGGSSGGGSGNNSAATYSYDANRHLISVTYASGATISYSYDAAGNLISTQSTQ